MTAKEIMQDLVNGRTEFRCNIHGEERSCTILEISLRYNWVVVRFDKPIKIKDYRYVPHPFSYDQDATVREEYEREIVEDTIRLL